MTWRFRDGPMHGQVFVPTEPVGVLFVTDRDGAWMYLANNQRHEMFVSAGPYRR